MYPRIAWVFMGMSVMGLACIRAALATPYFLAHLPAQQIHSHDSIPQNPTLLQKIGTQVDSLLSRSYRDSLLNRITRAHMPPPQHSLSFSNRQQVFQPYQGRVIRNIEMVEIPVFGPRTLNDTNSYQHIRLIRIANRLHTPTRISFIRRALFFQPGDRVDAQLLADNERYLRNSPPIEDAQINLIPVSGDSVDVEIRTKDLFEYGGNINRLDPTQFEGNIFDKNILGSGQGLEAGLAWHNDYTPHWYGEWSYTNWNLGHSFATLTAGYTQLNHQPTIDTGVYEDAWFVQINRPLYSFYTRFTGGLSLAYHRSLNIHQWPDSLFRNYQYGVGDLWLGYNFTQPVFQDHWHLAALMRQYNIFFTRKPDAPQLATDPFYHNRRYLLGQLVLYRQHYVVTHYLFGFGRTEDIPIGWQLGLSTATETYASLKRQYTGFQLESFQETKLHGLWHGLLELSSFWHQGSQDAIIHAAGDYYSRYLPLGRGGWRIFSGFDLLASPNPYFNKPLNINYPHGFEGYKNTKLNGYHRLNTYVEWRYYAPIRIYGFGFTCYAQWQGATLGETQLWGNRFYNAISWGGLIRNENLPVNTLSISASYYPAAPPGVKKWMVQITTIADIRFNIYALHEPSLINFE